MPLGKEEEEEVSQPWLAFPSLSPSPIPTFFPPAVRTGNLAKFNQVLDQFGDKFQADGTYTLIIRLRHNVIKTGRRVFGDPQQAGQAWGAASPSLVLQVSA